MLMCVIELGEIKTWRDLRGLDALLDTCKSAIR
jgi:hypothetical protein